jgi:4-oxalocrotonate tautomerase
MPLVAITLVEGKTVEQKRKVVDRITKAIVEELGTKPEAVTVTITDVPSTNYAAAGVLISDRK